MSDNENPTRPTGDEERAAEFQRAAETKQPGFVGELVSFMLNNKKWWLTPVILMLLLLGLLIILGGSGAAPFIYTIF